MWIQLATEILEQLEAGKFTRSHALQQSAIRYLLLRKTVSKELKDRAKKFKDW